MKLLPWAIEAYAVLSLAYRLKLRLRVRRDRRLLAEYHKVLDDGMQERKLAESGRGRRLLESQLRLQKRRIEMDMRIDYELMKLKMEQTRSSPG